MWKKYHYFGVCMCAAALIAGAGCSAAEDAAQGDLQAVVTQEQQDWYDEDGETLLLHMEYDTVKIEGDGCEMLAEGVEQWTQEQTAELIAFGEEIVQFAREDTLSEFDPDYYYSITRTVDPILANEQYVSFLVMDYSYTGGAHGNYGYAGATFDSVSGELLALEDVVADMEAFQAEAAEYIIAKLEEDYGDQLFEGYEETVETMWDTAVWYLDDSGITFVFAPYEVGPYAMGAATVTVPYGLFEEEGSTEAGAGQTAEEGSTEPLRSIYLYGENGVYLFAVYVEGGSLYYTTIPEELYGEDGTAITADELAIGSVVDVYGNGIMAESWPGQYYGVTKMVVVSAGTEEDTAPWQEELALVTAEVDLSEPPVMVVEYTTPLYFTGVTLSMGGYEWNVELEDGTVKGTIACGVHILEWGEYLTDVALSESTDIRLVPSYPMASVSVTRWSAEALGTEAYDEGEDISGDLVYQEGDWWIPQVEAGYVYLIEGEWEQGTAEYGFYTYSDAEE